MMTDVIADLLTRIRNANQRYLKTTIVSSSKLKLEIIRILKEEGFINDFKIEGDIKKVITIELKYQGKNRAIQGLKKISKPGLRVYVQANEMPRVLNGLGISIISTSKGIMTGKQARLANVGGEVLAFV